MDTESAIMLRNRLDKFQAAQSRVPQLIVRHKMQRNNSWNDQQNTDFIDTVAHGWICPPIYLIPAELEGRRVHYVFDGAHKLEAVFKFIGKYVTKDGKTEEPYVLKKLTSFSPLKDYIGKKFDDLPNELQDKILNYKFNINIIPKETADDSEALKVLWERLNKAGQKLNSYELSLPVIADLNLLVFKPSLTHFLKSHVFKGEESSRGQAEKILQMILATSDCPITEKPLASFSSKVALIKEWQTLRLGSTLSESSANTKKSAEQWLTNMKTASKYMKTLSEANCFVNDEGEEILKTAHRGTEVPFLLGRLVYHFKRPEEFNRICPQLAKAVKEKFLLTVLRNDPGRNGQLQRDVLKGIDEIVVEFARMRTPRLFSKEVILAKKAEQKDFCPLCKGAILPNHTYHGDHIVPYASGGETSADNCQVVHARCNVIKGAGT
jgi:hypothetical protein